LLAERTLPGLHSALIARLPPLSPDAQILDVGCGTGAWLRRLGEAGYVSLWGVDRDLSGFEFPSAKVATVDLDQDAFPFADQRFRLITAIEVIEHLENPGRLYRLAQHYLADGGHLLLTTPNMHSLVSRLRHLVTGQLGQFDAKGDQTHIAPLLLAGAERVFPRYGLTLVERWGYPERGSIVYRRWMGLAARVLGLLLPDDIPGDALCLLLRRDPA
jgi:2-polyprenyl-3-methyl-5-hydroxy-6-metoxy-1,4-benzoquinol methylase